MRQAEIYLDGKLFARVKIEYSKGEEFEDGMVKVVKEFWDNMTNLNALGSVEFFTSEG